MRPSAAFSATLAVAVVVFVAGVFAVCGGHCTRAPGHVRHVLPAGFRGLVVVIEDPAAPEVPFVGDHHVVHVPKDGVVRVRSATPLFAYVEDPDTWVFEDGTPVPTAQGYEADRLPPDAVRVFAGGTFSRGGDAWIAYDVVAEARDAWKVRGTVEEAFDRLFPRR